MAKNESKLTQYEAWLEPIIIHLKNQAVISLHDMDGVLNAFSEVQFKIEEQRKMLEASRDEWKRKYQELKNEKKKL